MKLRRWLGLSLILCFVLSGCQSTLGPAESRPLDTEPVATYPWMKGESPVPTLRIGIERNYSGSSALEAVSPSGIYFMEDDYIQYMDNGADIKVPLCGRPDCNHDTTDCNAYIPEGNKLSYYKGYLYALSGKNVSRERGELIRMEPDGSNHVVVYDFLDFAKAHEGDGVSCSFISEGYIVFMVMKWTQYDPESEAIKPMFHALYYYTLDGTMEEPKECSAKGLLYNCGDTMLCTSAQSQNGGEFGGLWEWDPKTNTRTYLYDDPGYPGYFDSEAGYYFKDGSVCRLTYKTGVEDILFETELQGRYSVSLYPDCLVIASNETGELADNHLYIYNWAFELVDIVQITYPYMDVSPKRLIIAETAERFYLTAHENNWNVQYYINKLELGSGNAKIYAIREG